MTKRIILFIFYLLYASNVIATQKMTVILDWFVNPNHAPIIVAKQQGFFNQLGLDVKIVAPADPSDPPKLVAVGKADLGIDYQPHYLIERQQGLPLMQVGTLIARPLNCLVVDGKSLIYSIKDLKGKRIGYSSSGSDIAILATMLRAHGLTLQDVNLINVHYGLTQSLLTGSVDAVIGMMRNFELIQLKLANKPGRAFFPEQHGLSSYSELIFITRVDRVTDKKNPLFFQALKKGILYLKAHPSECWNKAIKEYPELDNTLNRQAWFATIPMFSDTLSS